MYKIDIYIIYMHGLRWVERERGIKRGGGTVVELWVCFQRRKGRNEAHLFGFSSLLYISPFLFN